MSDISERLVVHCPFHEASSYLAVFVAEHQAGDDGRVRIALRLPISMFADRRPPIERSLVATLYPLHSISDLNPAYSVTWSPKTGVSFPEFAGALAVEKCPRDHCFGLIVSGNYESPLNLAGTMFDATFDRRITHGSARELLRSIADHVENAWAHDEAARAGYCPLTHFTRDWSDTAKLRELSDMMDIDHESRSSTAHHPRANAGSVALRDARVKVGGTVSPVVSDPVGVPHNPTLERTPITTTFVDFEKTLRTLYEKTMPPPEAEIRALVEISTLHNADHDDGGGTWLAREIASRYPTFAAGPKFWSQLGLHVKHKANEFLGIAAQLTTARILMGAKLQAAYEIDRDGETLIVPLDCATHGERFALAAECRQMGLIEHASQLEQYEPPPATG